MPAMRRREESSEAGRNCSPREKVEGRKGKSE